MQIKAAKPACSAHIICRVNCHLMSGLVQFYSGFPKKKMEFLCAPNTVDFGIPEMMATVRCDGVTVSVRQRKIKRYILQRNGS